MDLNLTEDQETIRDVFAAFFDRETGPERARAAEPFGFDSDAWDRLKETGAPGMGVPEAAGGAGASLADLVVVATEAGARIAPLPLIDHQVTARLLATVGACDANVLSGATIAGLVVRPMDGEIARTVPTGSVANFLIALVDDRLVATNAPPGNHLPNHGCLPLAHRDFAGAAVLTEGAEAVAAHRRAVDEWRTLTAATLVGIAREALVLGVEYVKHRAQFGRPVGSFQAIQHLLADLPGLIDGAHLLTAKAAWAGDRSSVGILGILDVDANDVTDFAALAAMALVAAGEAATVATDRSLHVHGGYGFSEEYDIQLYYRRARGLSYLLDDPARECRRLFSILLNDPDGLHKSSQEAGQH
ncbi:MAG: acyl-CoA dehydrogenase [Acidimicrobiales bacterium]|nr:acyl-CoA dehydrogenase [Acidimicrobiales bacterium]